MIDLTSKLWLSSESIPLGLPFPWLLASELMSSSHMAYLVVSNRASFEECNQQNKAFCSKYTYL